MDPAAAEAVRRRAVIALVDAGTTASLMARLSPAWSAYILPAVLLSTGAL